MSTCPQSVGHIVQEAVAGSKTALLQVLHVDLMLVFWHSARVSSVNSGCVESDLHLR